MTISNEPPRTVEWQGEQVPVYEMEVVDFSRLLSQEPAEVDKITQACLNEGYFQLDLTGIDGRRFVEDQRETLQMMQRFFEMPLEAKNEFGLVHPHLGYEPIGNRTGVIAGTRDGYEMLKVSRDEIQLANPLLPGAIKSPADLRTLENAIAGSNIVTKTILSALSSGMALAGAARFENHHRNDRPSTSTLAMMHYVPSDPKRDLHVGHQKHTDISSLTLLFTEQWGLQIRPPSGACRDFGFVEPRPGHAFVHVGDSLRFASGHRFQSCIHRVVPFDPLEHRYSIAYFLRAQDDTMFTDSEGRYVTSKQWHDEKFKAFTDPPKWQAMAPRTMILGGMTEGPEPAKAPAKVPAPVGAVPTVEANGSKGVEVGA